MDEHVLCNGDSLRHNAVVKLLNLQGRRLGNLRQVFCWAQGCLASLGELLLQDSWNRAPKEGLRNLQGSPALRILPVLGPVFHKETHEVHITALGCKVQRGGTVQHGHLHPGPASTEVASEPSCSSQRPPNPVVRPPRAVGVKTVLLEQHREGIHVRVLVGADETEHGTLLTPAVLGSERTPSIRHGLEYGRLLETADCCERHSIHTNESIVALQPPLREANQPCPHIVLPTLAARNHERVQTTGGLGRGVRLALEQRADSFKAAEGHGSHQRGGPLEHVGQARVGMPQALVDARFTNSRKLPYRLRVISQSSAERQGEASLLGVFARILGPVHARAETLQTFLGTRLRPPRQLLAVLGFGQTQKEVLLQGADEALLRNVAFPAQLPDLAVDHGLQHSSYLGLVTGHTNAIELVTQRTATELALTRRQTRPVERVQQERGRLCTSANHHSDLTRRQDGREEFHAAPAPLAPTRVVAHRARVTVATHRGKNQQHATAFHIRRDGVDRERCGKQLLARGLRGHLRHATVVDPDIHVGELGRPPRRVHAEGAEEDFMQPIVINSLHLALNESSKNPL
mmetsp:Transcript_96272/g.223194  ORF Transcript_96272/g.223194 Transcript_96272/m.223194 type:complete len:574 (-) Transcript_96272:411-2132(-)